MIHAKDRDMNRSRESYEGKGLGARLKRPYDQEMTMKDKMMDSDVFADSAPTGTLEKLPLADLHHGDHEVPLSASGLQHVVVPSPMGQDHPDHVPMTSKGSTKDQAHHGEGKGGHMYQEKSHSAPHKEQHSEKPDPKKHLKSLKAGSKY